MVKLLLFVAFVAIVFFTEASAGLHCTDSDENTDTPNVDEALQKFSTGLHVFAARFLKVMLVQNTKVSFIFSPVTVDFPIAEFLLYSTYEKSRRQLEILLNLDTEDEVAAVFRNLIKSYTNQVNVELQGAAKVYVNKDYTLSKDFICDTANFYYIAENIDCSNPEQAADYMNQQMMKYTGDRIQKLVSSYDIKPQTSVVVLNALYFKGELQSPFNPDSTNKRDFYVDKDTTVKVPTMYQKGNFKYTESADLNAKFLLLPYKNPNFTCILALPNVKDGLKKFIEDIQNVKKIDEAITDLTKQTVEIWLPTIEIETSIDLSYILPKVGVSLIFDSEKSGLGGILKDDTPINVTSAKQKLYVKIDDQESKASAATERNDMKKPQEFKADHPFLFCIYSGDNILLCGVFQKYFLFPHFILYLTVFIFWIVHIFIKGVLRDNAILDAPASILCPIKNVS